MITKISLAKAKFYLAGIGIIAFLGVVISLTFNFFLPNEVVITPEIPENSRDADMQFQEIHYTSTNEQGFKEWELKAVAANYYQEKKLAEFDNVNITFFSKEGEVYSVRGDSGILNTESMDIQLSGNIVGKSNDGYRFRTTTLTYKSNTSKAKTDDKVFLEGPQFNLEGRGMIMDLEKKKVFLLNDVKAQGKK